jgi:hypothetical protein
MRSSLSTACLRGLLTIAATGVGLFVLHAAYWWVWIYINGPGPEQEPFIYGHFLVMNAALIMLQLPVLLLGAIAAALFRHRYRIGLGLLSCLLLLIFTVTVPNIREPALRLFVYCFVLPLVVSLLQWLPQRRNEDPSNKGAAANRRPAGQPDGSDNLLATVAADLAFPAAVAELGR